MEALYRFLPQVCRAASDGEFEAKLRDEGGEMKWNRYIVHFYSPAVEARFVAT